MFTIIEYTEKERWDEIVTSFNNYDVYYLNGYVEAFRIHGDGIPFLVLYTSETNRGICVMMKRDISFDSNFSDFIPHNQYFDIITPYGYGGFIFDEQPRSEELVLIKRDLIEILSKMGIVSAFFRFHPLLNNADWSISIVNVIDLGKTIELDTSSDEIIWQNITSKNRNMIRKAEKAGVEIFSTTDESLFNTFIELYNATMIHDNANPYYFFKPDFYKSIVTDLKDNYRLFYAVYDNRIISMAIIIFANGNVHYHLSGSDFNYRNLAPSNLLLYKVALWACHNGFKRFHLGGGIGSGEDNLYKFKAAFNRNSNCYFSIGKLILDKSKYDSLVNHRISLCPDFDINSSFFPLYRS